MGSLKILASATQTTGEITGTTSGTAISMSGAVLFSAQCNVTIDTPANKTFAAAAVDTTADTATIAAHGYTTGDKVQMTTSGTLPAGLSLATDYFIIKVDANTVSFAASLANALVGTKIDLTTQGTGNHTVNVTALAGATVILQKSNDGTNWSDDGAATAIAASGLVWLEKVNPTAAYLRLTFTLTAGQMSSSNVYVVKGYN